MAMRDTFGRIVRGEQAANEKLDAAMNHCVEATEGLAQRVTMADLRKLTAALRSAIEACTEVATWRSDPRWFLLTPGFEQMLTSASRLQARIGLQRGSVVPPAHWTAMAANFRKMQGATRTLWREAEKNAVQGVRLR